MSDFEKRVQINKIIESQLPEFIVSDFPKATEFLRQYYVSQEFQGGNVDIAENLDQYLKLDNLVPEVITGTTILSHDISPNVGIVTVTSTKGFPSEYGLLKIDDEIITYTGITTNTFTGCVRGFSGITDYKLQPSYTDVNKQNLTFKESSASSHSRNSTVTNLSVLFLQEFYKKLKYTFTPGLENLDFVSDLDVGNFIKHARNFYQSKGIEESVKILFKVLYGVDAKVIDLESRLVKPSSANYIRREVAVVERISGNPFKLEGQTIYKSNDLKTNASVSNVEILTKNGKSYYKLELFVGYNDRDLIEGVFIIPGKTKVLESVSIGSSIISVDSTIGFPQSGSLISETSNIKYTSKSINQFFGCTGITSNIRVGSNIRSDETVYGYEGGDVTKRVDLRLTGVLSDFVFLDDNSITEENEEILVRNLGQIVENPQQNKTYTEVFANSWIYNTSCRFQVESILGSTFTLFSDIDRSSLKVGDRIDILVRNENNVVFRNALIVDIDQGSKQVILSSLTGFVPNPLLSYDIRRNLNKSTSINTPLRVGNSNYISDVLNVYLDDLDDYGYVATNSLPSYNIVDEIIESSIPNGTSTYLSDYNTDLQSYSIVRFSSDVRFIDGDEIVYTATNPLPGLVSGLTYIVKKVSSNQIRLFASKSLVSGTNYLRFGDQTRSGSHVFTLKQHENRIISSNSILRKIPTKQVLGNFSNQVRRPPNNVLGNVGILVDGVEISSPDSSDKVYYGPLKEFEVLNGGRDYDVVNPPSIRISAGAGITALVDPIISGTVKEVFVDPQDFDIENIISLSLVGGNGSGCILDPVVSDRFREVEFDSRSINLGGGIDINDETISFLNDHNFYDGQPIIYVTNGNTPLSIGSYGDSLNLINGSLFDGGTYIAKVINNRTIKLYNSDSERLSGINTIGFSTATSASGIHKFKTIPKKTLTKIKVLNGGSGYQHRKLRVNSSGISTVYNTITFKNHGFSTGDIVTYQTTENQIVGLSTLNRYSIEKVDSDRFKLINVGVGATLQDDVLSKNYVNIQSTGSGYQIFEYPQIQINATVSYGSTSYGQFVFTPIVTGKIIGAYLYEEGTGYGSQSLNFHKKPVITLKNGKNCQLNPIISNGRILEVQVLSGGSEYFSTPDLRVTGEGSGAILRPVIDNGQIIDVVVINSGIGYNPSNTRIRVIPRGSGAIFDTRVRDLTINDAERFSNYSRQRTPRIFSSLRKNFADDSLVYGIYGYSEDLAANYFDFGNTHSPIIGWAYDGNPIYGPFGYSDSDNIQSGVRIINPGYRLNTSIIVDRPSSYAPGFFIEDYEYNGSGDLDEHNGRFCRTPEFPNGIYAYFVGVTTSLSSNSLEPLYPYFIGNTFRSKFIEENIYLNQNFDFNNSSLVRNTFPYRLKDEYAGYDFVDEPYEGVSQLSTVNSVTKGKIDEIQVIDGGFGYKTGDLINFDEEGTGGVGLSARVSEIIGKDITEIQTQLETYNDCVFVWDTDRQVSAYYRSGFEFNNRDVVLISGLSTSVSDLSGSKRIGITTTTIGLAKTMTSYSSTPGGIIEDIFVSSNPKVSIGGSIQIKSSSGTEVVRILNNYQNGILRVKRYGTAGVAHSYSSYLNILQDRISIPTKTQVFESKTDDFVYFNARESVGIGTTRGGAVSKTYISGGITKSVSIPHRSIFLPNHPFQTGQRVTFTKSDLAGVDSLIVGNDESGVNTFIIPDLFTRTSDVYVINRGKDYIGLTTQVGLTTSSEGLFFYSDGSNNSEYLIKSNHTKITGQIDRIVTTVSIAQSHGMQENDTIKLSVVPNTIVGLGTTSALSVYFKDNKLMINQVGINSSQINTLTNTITSANHGYNTGDKVYYESDEIASGLTTGPYYVIKDTSSKFRLSSTLYGSHPDTEREVNIVGTGSSNHSFYLINPKIDVIKNSTLKFNLGDSSLLGYKFKIYEDQDLKTEFVSSGKDNTFNVTTIGTIGIGTASLSINYSENIPSILYYGLEKDGEVVLPDEEVLNYSKINYINSEYNGIYSIFGVSTDSFKISPSEVPTILKYTPNQVEKFEYSSKSSTNLGGSIGKVQIISEGFNFKKLPKFVGTNSQNGIDANVVAISTSVGKIKNIRIKDIGYEYSSDKTLRPDAYVPPIIKLDNFDTIDSFDIINPGFRYLRPPNLLIWNDETKEIVDRSSIVANTPNGSISEIIQIAPIFGLKSDYHKVISVRNSNGVGINSIITSNSGVATCTLRTPLVGFPAGLFSSGDEIFVEGIDLIENSQGTGYNSENYDFRFLRVNSYVNSNPAILTFSVVDENGVGLTTNPGIAKTFQSGYATVVNKRYYPEINIIKKRSQFVEGEQLFVSFGSRFFEYDVYVSAVRDDYIKVIGTYNLRSGVKIKGKVSGVIADVVSVNESRAKFVIDYSSKQNIGWKDDIGKLSEDYQVIHDSDYYQNLSYSIKSPIPWDTFSSPVNSNIHPTGLKNFADVGITSVASNLSDTLSGFTTSITVLDIFEEKRVDTINNFDNAIDYDIRTTNPIQSKYLKIQNRKLSDYVECRTNRVLTHDSISDQFSSRGFEDLFVEIEEIATQDSHVRYLIQVINPDTFETQLTELVLQITTVDSVLFEKYTHYTDDILGVFSANVEDDGRKTLVFTPTDPFETDHDIKILKKTFNSDYSETGDITFGSIKLIGSNITGISSVGTSSSISTLAEFSDSNFNGLFANIEIVNNLTRSLNYVEVALDFDGTNTYISEYYVDNSRTSTSNSSIGIVTAIYDSTSGIVSFRIQNNTNNIIDVRSNIICFTGTGSGIGTYRFLVAEQPPGSEKSVRLESTVGVGTTSVLVGVFDMNTTSTVSSLVRVSSPNESAIHQVSILCNRNDVIVSPGLFSPSNTASGLGTFGSQIINNQYYLNFYPDSQNDNVSIQSFNEVFYTESDFDNEPLALEYGSSTQKVFLSAYDGLNGERANKVNFNLKYQGIPIYKKQFTPSSAIDFSTGVITIRNHFFNTGEELIYRPKSTFVGVGESAIGIGATLNYLGIITDRLPELVYPIVINANTFKLATTKSYATLGIAVSFTDLGEGNAHELEMTDKLSKSVISLDGIVQQPITYTPISHTLQYNSGSINSGISTFNLSGISSIQPRDVLKIDDEYMKVVEVGVSSNTDGNILGIINASGIATFPTVSVIRGSLGSISTSHTDGTNVQIYRGSFNIVGSEVFFSEPPKGNTRTRRDESNLPYTRATYSGRTFLRSNYDTNVLFDDISDQFTGIGKTYTMTVEGINTTGFTIGNGILFINGIFQTPSTQNNSGNNYEFENDGISGISSVVFTGITSTDGTYIKSDFDINQNQLPRGGLIVSLGSTPGLGYAPLVGAKVRANLDGSGSIVSITGISHTGPGQSISTASYNNQTGIVEITTTTDHNFVGGDRIKLVGLGFTFPSGAGIVSYFPSTGLDYSYDIAGIISARTFIANVGTSTLSHSYIGFGTVFPWYDLDNGSGYRNPVSIGITDPNHSGIEASISAVVGAGGTLGFIINNGGSGYTNPYIQIPEPIYENLEVIGVSRIGIGTTTETGSNLLLNLKIGPSPSTVGIGSTLFVVESFEVSRPGYGFQVGDVFKPVGLVTAKDFSEPISEFNLEVVETFNDYFSAWSFGEMDYIDSIELLQNGSRVRFPLYYNGQLVSFQVDRNNPQSSLIDLNSVLLIFINGVLQEPGYAYQFDGGTSFQFTSPPKSGDKTDIFFYLGQDGVDVTLVDVNETIKIGDEVFLSRNPLYPLTQNQERNRTITDIFGSDILETDIYAENGIDGVNYKPFEWSKQKKDLYIGGDVVYKYRDSIEPQIYPTAKIIGDVLEDSSNIFVDNVSFFNYEEDNYGININNFDSLIIEGTDPVSAAFSATVSIAGTISSISIINSGIGYSSQVPVKISAPSRIGVGIGTTATAIANVSNGGIVSVSIIDPGFGYTSTNPPKVITEIPKAYSELIKSIEFVQGFTGIITGISTTTGIGGHPLALKINFRANASDANDLQSGYPIFVFDTAVGTGVTSVNSGNNSIVAIGTNFLDNIYIVNSKTNLGPDAEIICNIDTNTNIIGISTSGTVNYPIGKISWGRIYQFANRTNPISIGVTGLTVDSGLTTFPSIQRRKFGLRNSGAIRKISNIS